ncbi:MAG TPA: methyltransferase domain-containing protein [Planctomycetota bacterium]|nr:methyltransferase domain-containing protein [Planctomycetota bacterium]
MLDASAGHGNSTQALLDLGMQVTATGYRQERPSRMPAAAEFIGGVDLNARWPFPDGSFDGIHMQEVIEHLENPAHAVRECARVLKPDGVLVLSTPNMLNAASRVRFLLSGFYQGRKRPVSYAIPPSEGDNLYIPSLHLLHYLMAQSGMAIEKLGMAEVEVRTILAGIAFFPFLFLGTALATTGIRRHDLLSPRDVSKASPESLDELHVAQLQVQRRLRRLMCSKEALFSRGLLLRARKTGRPPLEAGAQ